MAKKFSPFLMALLVSALLSTTAQAGFLPDVAKACLPERAEPSYNWSSGQNLSDSELPPCHCPPKELCPRTAQEWKDHPNMPSALANRCCKGADQTSCKFTFQASTVSYCGKMMRTSSEPIEFCMETLPKKTANSELSERREKASETLNSCMQTMCDAKIETLKALKTTPVWPNYPYFPIGTDLSKLELPDDMKLERKIATAGTLPQYKASNSGAVLGYSYDTLLKNNNETYLNNMKLEGHFIVAHPKNAYNSYHNITTKLMRDAVSCQAQCRDQALEELDIDNDKDNGSAKFIENFTAYNDQEMPHNIGDTFKRVKGFAKAVFPVYGNFFGVSWNWNYHLRETWLQEYISANPPARLLKDELANHLTCTDVQTEDMCLTAIVNDGSCSTCLAPHMPILMADGTAKPIKEVSKGDVVKSAYGKTATVSEVVIIDWPSLTMYSINEGTLELTADHPVMTTTGWRAVDYNTEYEASHKKYKLENVPLLKVGDVLLTEQGELPVTSIEPMQTQSNAKTYNLKLEGADSFYAGGVLVKSN